MAIGTAADFVIPDECEGRVMPKRVLDSSYIVLSGDSVALDAEIGTVVGTLSVTAAYTGTPIWQLVNDEHGKFAVNSSTGVVTVAGDLSALDSASIKAKVRGISQSIFDRTFDLTLSGGGGGSSLPPLDIVSGAVFAFGHRALSAAMASQPYMTIRRDSDGTTQAFSFDGSGDAPSASIAAFIGSPVVRTAAITADSDLIVLVDATGIEAGQEVTGTGIPDETYVQYAGDAPTIQLSQAATATNGAVSLTFEVNGRVTVLKDQSGNGADLDNPNSNAPVLWRADQSNGRSGMGGSLNAAIYTTNNVSFGGAYTVFFVQKPVSQAIGFGMAFDTSSEASFRIFPMDSNVITDIENADTGDEASAQFTTPGTSGFVIYDAVCAKGVHSLRMNGASVDTSSVLDTATAPADIVDKLTFTAGYQDNVTLEFFAYPSVLSDADRTAIRQSIADYYGITIS